MNGNGNMIWKLLAFGFALPWMCACMAEPANPEGAKSTVATAPSSSGKSESMFPDFLTSWKLPETVQIHGFASQSYLHTSGNNFFGYGKNMGSLDFTEIGLNGSWRPLSQLQASMQIVYRRAGKTDNSNVRIDFGFLDYSFLSDADKLFGIRAGRVFNPYGLYNDTRDMPFTRPSIFLPQSVYYDANRNLGLSGDGVQVYGEYRTKFGDFFLNANGFYSRTEDPDLKHAFTGNLPGKFDGEPSWVTRLIYEWDGGRIRLGVTTGDLVGKYHPEGGPINLQPGTFSFKPLLFSAQYNAENWTLTSEYVSKPVRFNDFGPLIPDREVQGEGYYFQGTYRFSEKLEGFVRYDVLYWDTSDRSGKKFAAASGLPAHNRFAKDITAGLAWYVTTSIMVRAEYHNINGTGWISGLENTPATESQHWDLFALSLSFRF